MNLWSWLSRYEHFSLVYADCFVVLFGSFVQLQQMLSLCCTHADRAVQSVVQHHPFILQITRPSKLADFCNFCFFCISGYRGSFQVRWGTLQLCGYKYPPLHECQKLPKSVDFWQSYLKNQKGDIFSGLQCRLIQWTVQSVCVVVGFWLVVRRRWWRIWQQLQWKWMDDGRGGGVSGGW